MNETLEQMMATPAFQAFADHLSHCTQGCEVRMDGSGPLCADGLRLSAVDWELELAVQSGAVAYANQRAAVVRDAVAGAQAGRRNAQARREAMAGGCPSGGSHTPGTSGEWVGRCTKCGQPC